MVAGNLRATAGLRRLRVVYFVMHGVFLLFAVGLISCSVVGFLMEAKHLVDMDSDKRETGPPQIVFCIGGVMLICASIIGIFALLCDKKPYLWIIYCMTMSILSLTLFVSSASMAGNHLEHFSKHLNESFIKYQDMDRGSQSWKTPEARHNIDMIDNIQENNECCGFKDYSDWQDVEFGRTSLKVPRSCCKLKDNTGNRLTRKYIKDLKKSGKLTAAIQDKYHYCGHLCLPTHPKLEMTINTRGCFDQLTRTLHPTLEAMAYFGLIVSTLVMIVFGFSCFLVVTKRV